MNIVKIHKIIDEILMLVESIKEEIKESGESIKEEIKESGESIKEELNEEFNELKNLLKSEEWPEAVLSFQICDENSEEEKMDRAEGIVDILIEDSLKDKKFLDFGCGEGHAAKYASTQETKISVGYDIIKSENSKFDWEEKQENFLLSNDLEKVKSEGPYDVIMVYDVLDHAEDPTQVLKEAKDLLAEKGIIYLRCHPWCGRHGGHLYRQINKAFVHLVFTEEELERMGYKLDFTNKVFYPIGTYNNIIKDAGFSKKDPEIDRQTIEEFFSKNEIIKNRILKNLKSKKWEKQEPEFQLEQCFLDYKIVN
jgi:2-polyprenyl-3-methyl-5-hydroxy-6-metoxy-1,4-benzoquinol methylase